MGMSHGYESENFLGTFFMIRLWGVFKIILWKINQKMTCFYFYGTGPTVKQSVDPWPTDRGPD